MKCLFTCGGTGGHIFPAIAVAEQIKKADKENAILFAGNDDGMESAIVKKAGFDFVHVGARPFVRKSFFKNIKNFILNILALFNALKIIKNFKPDYVFGTGGFVSFPVCAASVLTGKKTVIHEPNTNPGLANLWIAPFVSAITLGFEETVKYFPGSKCHVTGNPVRESILKLKKKDGRKAFGIKRGKTILVMPGSRAAKSVNAAVLKALPFLSGFKGELNIIWMCGAAEYEDIKKAVKRIKKPNIVLKSFIDRPDLAYAACDAALLRAGASTLTEIVAAGIPSVLVPYPHATGNHQEKNSDVFEKNGAAFVVKDCDLDGKRLAEVLIKALDAKSAAKMKKELKKMFKGNGAVAIAGMLLNKEI